LRFETKICFAKVLIRNLEAQSDLRENLKQLENKVSIASLIQTSNQSTEKLQQLLANAQVKSFISFLVKSISIFQDALIQMSESVEYHEHFEVLAERYNQWMTEAESRLEKYMTNNENALDEHYRNLEV